MVLLIFSINWLIYAETSDKKNVLILNSYHRGYEWSDSIVKGIESEISAETQDVQIYFEYMDTKHVYTLDYLEHLHTQYVYKYGNLTFDAIITSDNNAFDFILMHQETLFPETPVVFCGVNDFQDSLIMDKPWITGVIEDIDIKNTLGIALKFHPNTNRVFLINDISPTGKALRNRWLEIIPEYEGALEFTFIDDFAVSELADRVQKLPENSLLLLLALSRDIDGKYFSYEEIIPVIADNSKVPIYSFWYTYLGRGIVGGMLTNGFYQGKEAAEITNRILQGEDIRTIPIVRESPNKYMFDYIYMKEHGLKLSELPKGSIVINKPSSFYKVHKGLISFIVTALVFSLLFIFILIFNIKKRRRAELQLIGEHSKLENALKLEKLISETARYLNSTETSKSVFYDKVFRNILKVMNIEGIIIANTDSESKTIHKIDSDAINNKRVNAEGVEDIINVSNFMKKIEKEKIVALSNLEEFPEDRVLINCLKIKSLIGILLEVEKNQLGFVIFFYNRPHVWSPGEISFFTAIANMIANTLDRHNQFNARLEVERRNTKAVELLEKSSRLASIGVMASGITHEINQPLNAIKVISDGILYWYRKNKDVLPTGFIDKIRNISQGSERIKDIIQHMRLFWATPKKDTEEIVNLNDAVESSLSLIQQQLISHGIETKIELHDGGLSIKGNYIQCEQVIINLISNAINALDESGNEGKELIITTKKDEDSIFLVVSDNGVGLPDGAGEELFDPFYSSKKPGDGMGLGLAIVKNIVQKFSGAIEAKNNETGGASFIVTFPII
jgi:C4-dicarboxylate-specific signal transduction histidine kinase/ABC-type uncharacterized transport system substrate-binding protein